MLVLLSPGGRITVASGAEALVAEVLVEAISGCTCPLDVLSLLVLGLLFCLLNQALMSILASCCAKLPTDLLLPKLKLLISNLERHLLFVLSQYIHMKCNLSWAGPSSRWAGRVWLFSFFT